MARIYLSSTYEDLKDYRKAVYSALRKLGHRVLAMEDYIATDQRPKDKCLEDVAGCEYYIGIFAWRYGYIPPGEDKSITELEFSKAGERGRPRLLFLSDKKAPWPPILMDSVTGENDRGMRIEAFRAKLGEEFMVSQFETPDQLAMLVSTAVSVEEAKEQLKSFALPKELTDLTQIRRFGSTMFPEIQNKLVQATQEVEATKLVEVDLGIGQSWWSTRLYILAALAADFTSIQQFVFIEHENRFIGMASPSETRDALATFYPEVDNAYRESIPIFVPPMLSTEEKLTTTLHNFRNRLDNLRAGGEASAKEYIRKDLLYRILGHPLRIESVVVESTDNFDIAFLMSRILEQHSTFVALTQNEKLIGVVDRFELAVQIARTVVKQQMRRE
jgi:hypothetical protein